ncbi:MAG TPA: type II toxin-antitoxin system HipA family toxin [Gammaproteobacteria bacterium]|nr:type II toxin-antitoxin system HipA family toxin [Gammaproteobacteria bacterium]
MNRDREAVVWTRLPGQPVRMGRLYITDTDSRFSYDPAYLDLDLPGLGRVLSPALWGERTLVHPRTARFDFPPPIQSLIPPREAGNFQRNLALRCLGARVADPSRSDFETDWEILKLAGHGGIGHLDVFADDAQAQQWYGDTSTHRFFEVDQALPVSLKDLLAWFDGEADRLLALIGPTPSVGGAIPKLLVSIPDSGWDGRIGPPTRGPAPGVTDVVLKLEQSATYPGITALEALALDVHRELGFEVPRYWLTRFRDIPAIAVERFDRDSERRPLFTETLFSVIASGNPGLASHYDFSYDGIARALAHPELELASDVEQARVHLFRRLVAAFLTGNGDLHLENLSLLTRDDLTGFSPVYDPTPMRAWPIHDMLNVMPFGHYGELPAGHDRPVGLREALRRFARHCGLSVAEAGGMVADMLDATRDYAERVAAIEALPERNRKALVGIHRDMCKRLQGVFV